MKTERIIPKWMANSMLFIVALVWGGGFIAVAQAVDTIPPFYMIFIRFTIASALLTLLFWKKFRGVQKIDLIAGLVVGILLFISFVSQTTAAKYLTAGKISFLTALNVVMVPFLAYGFYKEKIRRHHVISSICGVVGVALLSLTSEGNLSWSVGDLLGVLGALGFALHIVAVGYYSKKVDVLRLAMFQMMVAAFLGLACALLFEKPPTQLTGEIVVPLIYLGVGATFLCFLLQTVAQKYTTPSEAALILCLESVFGTLFGVVLLNEPMTMTIFVGCSLIFGGVVYSEYWGAKAEEKGEANKVASRQEI